MAWTQADIDAIDLALKSNTLTVRDSDGKQVTYRSVDELLRVRALAIAAVNGAAGCRRGPAIAVWN